MTAPRIATSLLTLALISTALGTAVQGCAIGTQRFGVVLDARQISAIKVGKSNKQDILDLFGPPTSFNRVGAWMGMGVSGPDGSGGGKPWGWPADDVFTYEYREENESFVTALFFTWFGRDVITDRLMVFFDPNDIVKYVAYGKQTTAQYEPAPSTAPERSDDDDDDDDDGDDHDDSGETGEDDSPKKKKTPRKKKTS